MFHAKICGIRHPQDVRAVANAGGDAVGLNFFPRSVRYLDPHDADTKALSDEAHNHGLLVVGVFVNLPPGEILRIAQANTLDAVQLHGDERVTVANALIASGQRVIRAVKLPTTGLTNELIQQRTSAWDHAGCHLLLDADAGSQHGGSGKQLQWDVVRQWSETFPKPWTLAGGLHPENVSEAIQESGASSVDTASGVEEPRGVKSEQRIMQFLAACRTD